MPAGGLGSARSQWELVGGGAGLGKGEPKLVEEGQVLRVVDPVLALEPEEVQDASTLARSDREVAAAGGDVDLEPDLGEGERAVPRGGEDAQAEAVELPLGEEALLDDEAAEGERSRDLTGVVQEEVSFGLRPLQLVPSRGGPENRAGEDKALPGVDLALHDRRNACAGRGGRDEPDAGRGGGHPGSGLLHEGDREGVETWGEEGGVEGEDRRVDDEGRALRAQAVLSCLALARPGELGVSRGDGNSVEVERGARVEDDSVSPPDAPVAPVDARQHWREGADELDGLQPVARRAAPHAAPQLEGVVVSGLEGLRWDVEAAGVLGLVVECEEGEGRGDFEQGPLVVHGGIGAGGAVGQQSVSPEPDLVGAEDRLLRGPLDDDDGGGGGDLHDGDLSRARLVKEVGHPDHKRVVHPELQQVCRNGELLAIVGGQVLVQDVRSQRRVVTRPRQGPHESVAGPDDGRALEDGGRADGAHRPHNPRPPAHGEGGLEAEPVAAQLLAVDPSVSHVDGSRGAKGQAAHLVQERDLFVHLQRRPEGELGDQDGGGGEEAGRGVGGVGELGHGGGVEEEGAVEGAQLQAPVALVGKLDGDSPPRGVELRRHDRRRLTERHSGASCAVAVGAGGPAGVTWQPCDVLPPQLDVHDVLSRHGREERDGCRGGDAGDVSRGAGCALATWRVVAHEVREERVLRGEGQDHDGQVQRGGEGDSDVVEELIAKEEREGCRLACLAVVGTQTAEEACRRLDGGGGNDDGKGASEDVLRVHHNVHPVAARDCEQDRGEVNLVSLLEAEVHVLVARHKPVEDRVRRIGYDVAVHVLGKDGDVVRRPDCPVVGPDIVDRGRGRGRDRSRPAQDGEGRAGDVHPVDLDMHHVRIALGEERSQHKLSAVVKEHDRLCRRLR
eukprot:749684-Hanusia_phi.AAC.4